MFSKWLLLLFWLLWFCCCYWCFYWDSHKIWQGWLGLDYGIVVFEQLLPSQELFPRLLFYTCPLHLGRAGNVVLSGLALETFRIPSTCTILPLALSGLECWFPRWPGNHMKIAKPLSAWVLEWLCQIELSLSLLSFGIYLSEILCYCVNPKTPLLVFILIKKLVSEVVWKYVNINVSDITGNF